MCGNTLKCGGITGAKTIKNPISLARKVMEKTPHILLNSEGVELFADKFPEIERVT